MHGTVLRQSTWRSRATSFSSGWRSSLATPKRQQSLAKTARKNGRWLARSLPAGTKWPNNPWRPRRQLRLRRRDVSWFARRKASVPASLVPDPSRDERGLDRGIGEIYLRDPPTGGVKDVDRCKAGRRAGSKPPRFLADASPLAG